MLYEQKILMEKNKYISGTSTGGTRAACDPLELFLGARETFQNNL